eukprot:6095763-Amphidinium_carterae.1
MSKPWQIVTTNGNASTTLRRQAELWMETEGLPDIWLTQERRRPDTEVAWKKALRKLGYKTSLAPSLSKEGGRSAGVAVHCKAHYGMTSHPIEVKRSTGGSL